jgi:hypothetical protein
MYIQTYYVSTQIFGKRIFYVSYIKKKILCMTIWLFTGHIFIFLPMPHKMFSFVKNLCANIECPDLHVIFYKKNNILKFVLYAFSIIGSYRPKSQNTSSALWYCIHLSTYVTLIISLFLLSCHINILIDLWYMILAKLLAAWLAKHTTGLAANIGFPAWLHEFWLVTE